MNTHEILKVLQEDIHTVIIAQQIKKVIPIRVQLYMMLLEDESLYFFNSERKSVL